jgi:HK97 family phage portal protein
VKNLTFTSRVKSFLGFGAAEGSWRGPFYGQGELGGWYELGKYEDGFQRNLTVGGGYGAAPVYSCIMLNSRAVSQCEPKHLVPGQNGAMIASTTSPASRVLRIPNSYETWTQMIYNTCAEMLFQGESLWLVTRDDRFAITAAHRIPRGTWSIYIDPESKEVFYSISATDMIQAPDYLVPARDVCHFRQHTPRHPLAGESPIKAAALAIGINVALNNSQLAFFSNMNRPSGIIETPVKMTKEQKEQAREAFSKQSKAWNQGLLPILSEGAVFKPMNVSQTDSQLLEQLRYSTADICRVFGVPVALMSETSGTQTGTEALISHWLSIGLGSLIESIERSLDRLFNLPAGEHIELDATPLLRVDFAGRIEGLVKAVQGGLLTPDEARAKEGFGSIEGGDQAFLQRQMTPMSQLLALNQAELAAKNNIADPEPIAQDPEPVPEKHIDAEVTKALVISMRESKRKLTA